jgi:Flp pilus assembly pilin Flp
MELAKQLVKQGSVGDPVDTRADDHVDLARRSMVSGFREDSRMDSGERSSKPVEQLRGDERGAVYVEYLVVASMVTITGAAAVVTLGVPLYNLYRYVEMMILLPVP